MKSKVIILLLLALASSSFGQQEAQYSMYMFNPLSVNPAYAGSRNALSILGLYRQQWVGFKGAPKTANFTIHSPIKYTNLGLGMNVVNDQLGTINNTSLKGNVSYRVQLNKKKDYLSFGLSAGVDLFDARNTRAFILDNSDNLYQDVNSRALFNTGAGIYYYGKKHYLGLCSPKLMENRYDSKLSGSFKQTKHYYLMGGIVLPLSSVVQFKPSFVLKAVTNAPLSFDINTSFLFYEKIWIGAMYRLNESCGLNTSIYLNEYMTFGYAFDYTLSNLSKYNSGSHEIFLSFDLYKKSKSFKTPRYF